MSSPLSTAMFIVYNIESIPSNVSRVVSTKYLHGGEKMLCIVKLCMYGGFSVCVHVY